LFAAFVVGTYKLVGKQIVTNAVNAALTAGYRLIGVLTFIFYDYLMFIIYYS